MVFDQKRSIKLFFFCDKVANAQGAFFAESDTDAQGISAWILIFLFILLSITIFSCIWGNILTWTKDPNRHVVEKGDDGQITKDEVEEVDRLHTIKYPSKIERMTFEKHENQEFLWFCMHLVQIFFCFHLFSYDSLFCRCVDTTSAGLKCIRLYCAKEIDAGGELGSNNVDGGLTDSIQHIPQINSIGGKLAVVDAKNKSTLPPPVPMFKNGFTKGMHKSNRKFLDWNKWLWNYYHAES